MKSYFLNTLRFFCADHLLKTMNEVCSRIKILQLVFILNKLLINVLIAS